MKQLTKQSMKQLTFLLFTFLFQLSILNAQDSLTSAIELFPDTRELFPDNEAPEAIKNLRFKVRFEDFHDFEKFIWKAGKKYKLGKTIKDEYFVKHLIEEIKKEKPYVEPDITNETIFELIIPTESRGRFYYYILDFEREFPKKYNDYFKIGKHTIDPDFFTIRVYAQLNKKKSEMYKEFKIFKKYSKDYFKNAGIKKKSEQEVFFMTLKKNVIAFSKKIIAKQTLINYERDIFTEFIRKYYVFYPYTEPGREHNLTKSEQGAKLEKLLIEKISPYFDAFDNTLIPSKYRVKNNTSDENEALKKRLLDKGIVYINKDVKTNKDGFTFIFPELDEKNYIIKKRVRALEKYFKYDPTDEEHYKQKERILKLWYGNLDNEFVLDNFLKVCGDNVPSKEAFLSEKDTEGDLKALIEIYAKKFYNRGYNQRNRYVFNNSDNKNNLLNNVIVNHYGINIEDLNNIRNELSARKEKEESEKGGFLRNKSFYKINSQGKFDYINFESSLDINRKLNQSRYSGAYEKKSGNVYRVTFLDTKTRIELPEFEARLSSDKTKLYIGNDKVPYILEGSNGINYLKQKAKDNIVYWDNADESFFLYYNDDDSKYEGGWDSKITGGIGVNGSVYKISNSKYAFIIENNSWGGNIANNLVIIRTENNCNTIYYGSGKKKMTFK
jgi:hypothetical protein